MIPSTYYLDEDWGRGSRAEAHCSDCGRWSDLVPQPDGKTFRCRMHHDITRARAVAKPFGPTNDLDLFFARLEVATCQ